MKSILVTLILSMLGLVIGCTPVGGWLFSVQAERIEPNAFSRDPLTTRLAIAVDHGDEEGIASAIQAGANVDGKGQHGFCLLYWAIARNNPRGFELLLEHGANLEADYRDPKYLPDESFRYTVLEKAIASREPECLKRAIRLGLDPNHVPHPEDDTPLIFYAQRAESMPALAVLLDAGADINRRDGAGYTAVVRAMSGRDYNTAWFLLKRGADPTVKDERGRDLVSELKEYGSRGVRKDQSESFEKVVNELVRRGLLAHQDIIEADKPKRSALRDGPPGITVIEHSPDSEAGQAILELDRAEREANRRDRR